MALCAGLLGGRAEADAFEDFLHARDRYNNGDYPVAAREFRALLSRPGPEAGREVWWSLARRLYAASLWSDGQERAAASEIEAALRDDPDASLDEVQFDLSFSRLFSSVRDNMQSELARLREERLRQRQAAVELAGQRRRDITELLSTETRVEGSRWTVLLPFGGAQFANHQPSLGFFFLGIETLTLGASVVTWLVQQSFVRSPGNLADADLHLTLRAIEGVNYASVGLLAASVVGGLIQAAAAYSPRITARSRPLPPSLQNVQFSLSPVQQSPTGALGAAFTLRF